MRALLELREYLHSSSLLLDVSYTSLEQLYDKVVDTWIEDGALGVHERSVALDMLNRRLRHQHETNEFSKLNVPSLLHAATTSLPAFLAAFGMRSSGINANNAGGNRPEFGLLKFAVN